MTQFNDSDNFICQSPQRRWRKDERMGLFHTGYAMCVWKATWKLHPPPPDRTRHILLVGCQQCHLTILEKLKFYVHSHSPHSSVDSNKIVPAGTYLKFVMVRMLPSSVSALRPFDAVVAFCRCYHGSAHVPIVREVFVTPLLRSYGTECITGKLMKRHQWKQKKTSSRFPSLKLVGSLRMTCAAQSPPFIALFSPWQANFSFFGLFFLRSLSSLDSL